MTRYDLSSLCGFGLLILQTGLAHSAAMPTDAALLALATQSCQSPLATPLLEDVAGTKSELQFGQMRIGERHKWQFDGDQLVSLELRQPPGRAGQTVLTTHTGIDQPALRIVLDHQCTLQQARRVEYDANQRAVKLQHLDPQLEPTGPPDWLNPAVPATRVSHSAGLRIGMLDSGVNYLIDEINDRLARNADGSIVGYDFWDMDARPFDANPARSMFQIQRHGTRTASVLLREAPGIQLVPYRYPRPDMSRMQQLVAHASANQVRIIGMPLGSNRYADWAPFAKAAEAHPDILFIASAGNNGRDIDIAPVYPAGLEIDNLLVVTSADDFIRPAERTNYGRIAVDYMLPAEAIEATDFDGTRVAVSGSSYAVPRLVALAARLLAHAPEMSTASLKRQIQQRAVRARTGRFVSIGYIGDPLADRAKIQLTSTTELPARHPRSDGPHIELPLSVLALTNDWSDEVISASLNELAAIFEQCNIQLQAPTLKRYAVSPWLSDLATGPALTVLSAARDADTPAVVVFASDTRMQTAYDAEAFGHGNTANRHWMRNSVWLTRAISEPGIALAHELFHVLANSGSHTGISGNLMQQRTTPEQTRLSREQCDTAVQTGLDNRLLQSQ